MALYFQWDEAVSISECEEELENQRLQIAGSMIAALVAPLLVEPFAWAVASNAAERAYNSIYCAVRNTPNRLDTLYGE